jgi:hypothetical protein
VVNVLPLAVALVGTVMQGVDAVAELGAETARMAGTGAAAAAAVADRAYRDAVRRGQATAHDCSMEARRRLDVLAEASSQWLDHEVVRRVAASMTPYLVDQLMPTLIEGALPLIRTRVVPLIVADLAQDEQIRDLIAQQSRGMAAWTVAEVRKVSTSADDRVEVAARRMLRRFRPADERT